MVFENTEIKIEHKIKPENMNLNISKKNQKIYSKSELDSKVFEIKKLYNEIKGIRISNENKTKYLDSEIERYELKIVQLQKPNIELYKKVGLFNTKEIEITEKFSLKIDSNQGAKNNLLTNDNLELQYQKTLAHMITQENLNLIKTKNLIQETQEKIKIYSTTTRNLLVNLKENDFYEGNTKKLKDEMSYENRYARVMVSNQKDKLEKLDFKIKKLEEEKKETEVKLEERMITLENQICRKKVEITKKCEEAKIDEKLKLIKENSSIKIILGLNLIKRYLMTINDSQSVNETLRNFYGSDDYLKFKDANFFISFPNGLRNEKNKSIVISFDWISRKYNELEIDYNDLFGFHTKLLNKKNFNHSRILDYNIKQIKLENLRENYEKRVSNILIKDSFNIVQMIKTDSKLESLVKKYNFHSKPVPIKNYEFNFKDDCQNGDYVEKIDKLSLLVNGFFEFILVLLESQDKNLEDQFTKLINTLIFLLKNYFHQVEKEISDKNYVKHLMMNLRETTFLENFNNSKINEKFKFEDLENLEKFIMKEESFFTTIDLKHEYQTYYLISYLNQKFEDIFTNLHSIITVSDKFATISTNLNTSTDQITSNSFIQSNMKKKETTLRFPSSLRIDEKNFDRKRELDEDEEEDENSILNFEKNRESQVKVKKFRKIKKNPRIRNLIENLYNPFLNKVKFHLSVNENMGQINRFYKKQINENFVLKKKMSEFKALSKEVDLLENKKIDLNQLSRECFKTFINPLINNRKEFKNVETV